MPRTTLTHRINQSHLQSPSQKVALLLGGAAAGEECGLSLTFFPAGAEDFNVPVAWGRSHQRKAGNRRSDQLFTVLLSSKDNLPGSFATGVPTLQVQPVHPLLKLGESGINVTCRGGLLGLPPLPKAPGLDVDDIVEAGRVQTMPRVRISYRLRPEMIPEAPAPDAAERFVARYGAANATVNPDMAEAELARQIAKLEELSKSSNSTVANKARKALSVYEEQRRRKEREREQRAAGALATEAAWYKPRAVRAAPLRETVTVGEYAWFSPAPRIRLEGLEGHPDGLYCLEIVATMVAGTGQVGEYAVPARDMTAAREVCFYKQDAPPTARVAFESCGEKFAMRVTDARPPPVEVFPGTGKMLFTPVYHFKVWGFGGWGGGEGRAQQYVCVCVCGVGAFLSQRPAAVCCATPTAASSQRPCHSAPTTTPPKTHKHTPKATLNRTAKWWEPVPEGQRTRFDYWAVIGKPLGGGGGSDGNATAARRSAYAYAPDEDAAALAEGWWVVEVDGALLSEFPSLLSAAPPAGAFGKRSEDDPDERGQWRDMPPRLEGLPRYGAARRNLTRLFGLQSRATGFNSFNGPDGPIAPHEEFQFSWCAAAAAAAAVCVWGGGDRASGHVTPLRRRGTRANKQRSKPTAHPSTHPHLLNAQTKNHRTFKRQRDVDGFGHQYCYLDGERRQNDADFTCRSPLNAQVPGGEDGAGGGANHTVLVLMQDVCGRRVKILAKYGTWGYSLEEATRREDAADGGEGELYEAAGNATSGGGPEPRALKRGGAEGRGGARRSGAGAGRAVGGAAAAAASAAAAAVALFLML